MDAPITSKLFLVPKGVVKFYKLIGDYLERTRYKIGDVVTEKVYLL